MTDCMVTLIVQRRTKVCILSVIILCCIALVNKCSVFDEPYHLRTLHEYGIRMIIFNITEIRSENVFKEVIFCAADA